MSLHANILAVMADINGRTTAEAIHDALVERSAMPRGMGYGAVTAALRALCSEKKVRRDGLLNDDPAFELVAEPDTKRQDPEPEPEPVEIQRFLDNGQADAFPGVDIDGPRAGVRPVPAADPVTWVGGYLLVPMAFGNVLVSRPGSYISMVLPAEVIKAIGGIATGTTPNAEFTGGPPGPSGEMPGSAPTEGKT